MAEKKKTSCLVSGLAVLFFGCCMFSVIGDLFSDLAGGAVDTSAPASRAVVSDQQPSTPTKSLVAVPSVDFTIEGDSTSPTGKRTVTVRLPRKVDEETLADLARYIESDAPNTRPTFIVYLLPGQLDGAGAWATTHFNPELNVRILGSSATAENSQKPSKDAGKVVGQWNDHRMGMGKVVIYKEGGDFLVETYFADGSGPLRQSLEKRGKSTYWVEDSSTEDRYIILPNGSMEIHDLDGLIAKCPKAN